jgi:hypothetical protein
VMCPLPVAEASLVSDEDLARLLMDCGQYGNDTAITRTAWVDHAVF